MRPSRSSISMAAPSGSEPASSASMSSTPTGSPTSTSSEWWEIEREGLKEVWQEVWTQSEFDCPRPTLL